MATYPIINKVTGEQKEIVLSVDEWTQWCADNPDWQRDWSDPSTCPGSGEIGEWKSKLANQHSGWKTVLDRVKNTANSNAKDLY